MRPSAEAEPGWGHIVGTLLSIVAGGWFVVLAVSWLVVTTKVTSTCLSHQGLAGSVMQMGGKIGLWEATVTCNDGTRFLVDHERRQLPARTDAS